MNRIAKAVVTFLVASFPAWALAQQELTVFVADNLPPKMFLGKNGHPTGFMTELTEEIVRRAGFTPRVVSMPWVAAVKSAAEGKGFITNLSKNPEREKNFLFSDPIYEDRVLIVSLKKSRIEANGLAELKGRKVGLLRGVSYGEAFERDLKGVVAEPDDGVEQRVRRLISQRIDAAIISGGFASVRYNAELSGVPLVNFKVHSTPLAIDHNHIAITKTRADAAATIEKLNAAIAAVKADGTAKKILAGWE